MTVRIAVRAVLVLTAVTGLLYPLAILGIAQLPGLRDKANGSIVEVGGEPAGSSLIAQPFDGSNYFHPRPSAADFNPDATAASNLGPESIELLNLVCERSKAVGELEGVDGSRPFCTGDGVGAVLRVFYSDGLTGTVTRAVSVNQRCPAVPFLAAYSGVPVECATPGEDGSGGVLVPIRGGAPDVPAVPADAVAASASGLDPHISVAYARLQAPRVARERGLPLERVNRLIDENTAGRALGFMGEPGVNVLLLNIALDKLPG
ncbi:MAG TPA: potassium-transporting ATPase subunit C [Candidatus Limnocylindrales bacterium]